MRKKGFALSLVLVCMAGWGSIGTAAPAAGTETASAELTIWLDSGSEAAVRNALYSYVTHPAAGGGEESPEFSWRLVDKSYLTPEQFQGELLAALDAGGGPDLIFMDSVNGVSPEYLMENDYLMELGDVEGNLQGQRKYLAGVLEAGRKAGKQFVLPVYVQCPVVFGVKEELEAAGIDAENGFSDLKDFMEKLTEAAETTGKQIFEDETAADWMEACCMASAGPQEREELESLLQEVRKYCGDKTGFFEPYEALAAGECLLSGSYLSNKSRAIQNIALLGEEEEISFLNLPSWEGTVRAMVTWAAAVNANTRYPREAAALLEEFQLGIVCGALASEDFPALGDREGWKTQLKIPAEWTESSWKIVYGEEREKVSLSSDITGAFGKYAWMAVNDAVYQNKHPRAEGIPRQDAEVPEADVLTVAVPVAGMGTSHPLYQWLEGVASEYAKEAVRVQLIPVNSDQNTAAVDAYTMHLADAGPDVLLGGQTALETPFGSDLLGEWYTDLTPFLPEDASLTVTEVLGQARGLAWGESGDGARIYLFTVSESSLLKKEAVSFCLRALESEDYERAVQTLGLIPAKHTFVR